jgi:RHS repeat-associated protein
MASIVGVFGIGACQTSTPKDEQVGKSLSAISSPAGIPCAARAEAVIANTGNVFSNSGSLVDSYQSSVGPYGGTNIGTSGNVQAAETIVHNGGIIHGAQTPDVAAGLAVVPVPAGATNLPLGSKTPGSVDITTAAESLTLAPGSYVVANLTVGAPAAITVSPVGPVQIWVTGSLNLGGNENLHGIPENFEILVTSSQPVNVNVSQGLFGFLYAPTSMVSVESNVFGGVVGSTVNLNASASVHFDQNSVCPVADAGSDAASDAPHDASPDVVLEAAADAPTCTASSCNTGNPCSLDVCNANGTCSHTPQPNGTSCPQSNLCFRSGTCESGTCTGTNPISCTASDQCHVAGTCSPSTGICSNPTATNGTACNDGNPCDLNDTCQSGACTAGGSVVCTASDQCHVAGTCSPSSGVCSNPTAANGTACNDGNPCDLNDTCQSGACTAGGSVVCTAIDSCHLAGTCSPSTGVCSNPVAPSCSGGGGGSTGGGSDAGTDATVAGSDAGPDATPETGGASGPDSTVPDSGPGVASGFVSTVPTNLVNTASFLWEGNPLINVVQVAVVRGRVLSNPNGSPVAGASVTILNHPESGAMTGSDGVFSIPVNGGAQVTVQVQAPGYFTVQRHIPTEWHQYAVLPDIWLTSPDPNANPIALDSASYQIAQGSTIPNAADTTNAATPTRTARILFAPGTDASFTYGPCGSCGSTGSCATGTCDPTTNLCTGPAPATLTVRATEYAVGQNGPASLPADLKPGSVSPYAVELTADEEGPAGANGIAFTTPVSFYLDNFLGFPSGTLVPANNYDRIAGDWVTSAGGAVIAFSITTDGCAGGYAQCAVLDAPSQALGLDLSAGELNQLALTYPSAASTPVSLMRVAMTHFSIYVVVANPNYVFVLDQQALAYTGGIQCLWPCGLSLVEIGPPSGAIPPNVGLPILQPPLPLPDACPAGGSIIECDNQILAQQLPLAGTPFALRYQSERAPGHSFLNIPLTSTTIPPSLDHILLTISVAGVQSAYTFPASSLTPNQTFSWTWNRLDAFGNVAQGPQTADVTVSYVYPITLVPSATATQPGNQYPLSTTTQVDLGLQDAEPLGLGGWTLSANHIYDSNAHVFWGGDGKRRGIEGPTSVIQTVAGVQSGLGVQTCAQNSSGNGQPTGDNGPALGATFNSSSEATGVANPMAAGPDGSLYIGDFEAIRRIDPQGIIHHFAGNQTDSGPPSSAGMCSTPTEAATSWVDPISLAVGPDSSVYVASTQKTKGVSPPVYIQKIDPQGNLTTIAGYSGEGFTGPLCADGPLGVGGIGTVFGLSVAPDGSLVFADEQCQSLRRVGTDGVLVTVAGSSALTQSTILGVPANIGDGGPVSAAVFSAPMALAVAPDSTIYIGDFDCHVRRVDPHTGIITTVLGTYGGGTGCINGEGNFPPPSTFPLEPIQEDGLLGTGVSIGLIGSLSVSADGTLYVTTLDSTLWSLDTLGVAHVIADGAGVPVSVFETAPTDNGAAAQQGYVVEPTSVASSPNGSTYVFDERCLIRAISPTFPGYVPGVTGVIVNTVASEDGSEVYGFDSAGLHLATFDPTTGATLLAFGYDPGTEQLTSVVDANGNTTTISRSGSTVTITPPFGQATSSQQTILSLDSNGYATAITDPAGETTQCAYSNGLMTSFQTGAGYLHQFTYDGMGNLLTDQDPTGATESLTQTMTSGGNTPGMSYVAGRNWIAGFTSGAGHATTHGVTTSATGLITQTATSPSGATSSYSRSATDARTQTLSDGTVSTITMEPDPRFGMLDPYPTTTVVQTPSGLVQTTTQTRTATGPTSAPTTMTQTVTVNGIEASLDTFAASSPGGNWTHVSPAGRVSQETIDGQGRVIGMSFPGSQLASEVFTYGATGGRLSSVVATSGGEVRQWTTTYDSPGLAGYVATMTDPTGNVTTYASRDGVGRPTNVLLPDHATSPASQYSAAYDNDGNMMSLTVPPATSSSSQHNFSSTSLDLLGVYAPPTDGLTSSQTSYGYNADRLLQSISTPVGTPSFATISTEYDAFGRLSSTFDPLSGVTSQLAYNAADRVATASRSDGTTLTYTYDGFLKTSAALSGTVSGSVSWTYDNFFRVAQRSINGGSVVVYGYDNDDLFTGTSSPTFTVERDYVNGGRIAGTTLGSVSDTSGYNGFGELMTYTAISGANTPYQLNVTSRDLNGRIVQMTEEINGTTHNWSLGYDSRGRLTSATRDSVANAYTYDPNGNRLTVNGGETWTYDSQDRLLSAPSISYTYRNDGTATSKTTSGGTYGFVYDLRGFLQEVSLPSGGTVQYTADARDRRIAKSFTSGSTTISQQFVYDGQVRVAAELANNGATVTSVFVYGAKQNVPDYMISVKNGGKVYRILSDWLGSVRLVLDTTTTPATVIQQLDYDEFGNVLPSSFDSTCAPNAQCFPFQPFGFAGGIQDRETGLVRFGARDYDPEVGRWLAKDYFLFNGGSLGLYAYCNGDPVGCIDMTGRSAWALVERVWGAGVEVIQGLSRGEALEALIDAFENNLQGGAHVATDDANAARQLAQDYSEACGGSGTVSNIEKHGNGVSHVHGELTPNGPRLPGHVFFDPQLFEDIADILIPGPIFIGPVPAGFGGPTEWPD